MTKEPKPFPGASYDHWKTTEDPQYDEPPFYECSHCGDFFHEDELHEVYDRGVEKTFLYCPKCYKREIWPFGE